MVWRNSSTLRSPSRSQTLGARCLALEATACTFRTYSHSTGLASGARSLALVLRLSGGETSMIQAPSRRSSHSCSCNPTSLPWAKNAAPSA